ncbi:MAG TPA: DUF411 domain-containing protein [Acidimicrobiia bacterium]|nr:DUF411 domain-containing protein [Acidimicrobiia bacterium]
MQENGAEVDQREEQNLAAFKADVGVPDEAVSCHTALVGGYVVEGHVPVRALIALLEKQPQAIGIALAGMPPDSPGMGGTEATWDAQPVVLINHDGSIEPFDY